MEVKRTDHRGYQGHGNVGVLRASPISCLCLAKHRGGTYPTNRSSDSAQDSGTAQDLAFSTQPNPEINERFLL